MRRAGKESSTQLTVFQYWDEERVPDYLEELIESVGKRNPGLRHRIYSRSGTEELIATHFGERELACFRALAVPSMQSDYFRYCVLLAHGGVYLDIDSRCVGSLEPLLADEHDAHVFCARGTFDLSGLSIPRMKGSPLISKRPGHPLLEAALAVATLQIEWRVGGERNELPAGDNPGCIAWTATGPAILWGLWLAQRQESLEAFSRLFADTRLESFTRAICETAGEDGRLAAVFEGVGLSQIEDWDVVQGAGIELPYKSSERHWLNFRSDVYSSPA